MSKKKTRARPKTQKMNGLEQELRNEWAQRVSCGECRYRLGTFGVCCNPRSVKHGDYVLPGATCPKAERKP